MNMTTIMGSRVEVVERMTTTEFFQDAPETRKAELIDGVMVMPPPPLDTHESLQGFLFTLLRTYVEEHELGIVRGSRTAVELAADQVYEPDVLFIAHERLSILKDKGVFGAPDLVIEILSASTAAYDRNAKLRGYERAAVRELWLIDPYGPAGTEFYHLTEQRFVATMPGAQGHLHSIAVPGFWINTAWLWPAERFISMRQALTQIEAHQ